MSRLKFGDGSKCLGPLGPIHIDDLDYVDDLWLFGIVPMCWVELYPTLKHSFLYHLQLPTTFIKWTGEAPKVNFGAVILTGNFQGKGMKMISKVGSSKMSNDLP